jgi:hypothetical protein
LEGIKRLQICEATCEKEFTNSTVSVPAANGAIADEGFMKLKKIKKGR